MGLRDGFFRWFVQFQSQTESDRENEVENNMLTFSDLIDSSRIVVKYVETNLAITN